MSPASYLTAPPRGVARIVAPSLRWSPCGIGRSGPRSSSARSRESRHSHCSSCARCEAWRAFQQTRGAVVGGLDEFAAQAEAVADKLAAAGDTAELQESVGRLRVSLARLDVLRAALDEVDGTVGRVTAYLPHK